MHGKLKFIFNPTMGIETACISYTELEQYLQTRPKKKSVLNNLDTCLYIQVEDITYVTLEAAIIIANKDNNPELVKELLSACYNTSSLVSNTILELEESSHDMFNQYLVHQEKMNQAIGDAFMTMFAKAYANHNYSAVTSIPEEFNNEMGVTEE